jgi:hypothetical protein
MCARGLLRYAPLDPARGRLLTNGDFAEPSLDAGFDWRTPPNLGVAAIRSGTPPFLRFSLSGKQPEQCPLLAQLVPAEPATAYTLRFEYQTSQVAPDTGLRWRIYDEASGADLAPRSPHLSNEQWKQERVRFATNAATRWVLLLLTCQRMPGSTRIEGALSLRGMTLGAAR